MELGSRALDQNVYSIRCWRWKLPKFRLCPKREWFTFGQFSVLSKGLTQYHSTFYEFQASHLQWYFSSEGILASAWSRSIYEKGGLGFSGNQLHTKVTQKTNKHTTAPDIRESIGELRWCAHAKWNTSVERVGSRGPHNVTSLELSALEFVKGHLFKPNKIKLIIQVIQAFRTNLVKAFLDNLIYYH